MTDESLFAAALAIPDPAARAAYLDRACAGNPTLRQEVEHLLAAHAASNPLDRPLRELSATGAYGNSGPTASVGERIGPYKLLERIGEGGMGEVWVADQQEPIKRRVALKLIKPGMDSRSVLGRFEAERQALAVMDHPNIARVLDAGTTPDGRPYFVMELVKGTPITQFCDARKLTPKERLELFIPVCQAIQHAHQKGIIHRDIKPGNVLVALHDEKPIPKVIDFGVAKAVGQQLTEKTIYTGFGALVGTPAYMAPEQATFNQLDVDTRADVYALGVLLYELLAGSPPIEKERLKQAALDEILRLVREEEPPRPSARLSTSQAKATIAAVRQTEPEKLSKLIRGELDWIVMKALEKDRTRRYDTATGFAADVQRYLAGEPVQAVPPSTAYRLRKFARKHRAALTTVCTIAALLVAGIGVSAWQAVRATRAEAQASQDRADAIDQRQLAERRATEAIENERKAREAEESSQAVLDFVKDNVFHTVTPEQRGKGLGKNVTMREAINAAEPKIAAAFGSRPRVEAQVRMMLVGPYAQLGDKERADAQLERALALARTAYGPDDPFTVNIEYVRAYAFQTEGRWEEGKRLLEEALARRRKELGPAHAMTRRTMADLSEFYRDMGRGGDARKLAEELLQGDGPQFNADSGDPEKAWIVASLYSVVGKPDETVRRYEALLPRIIAKFGPDDSRTLSRIYELAYMLGHHLKRRKDAITLLEPAYQRAVRTLGANDDQTLKMMQGLTVLLAMAERNAEAARILEAALPALRDRFGPADPRLGPHYINLSESYKLLRRYQDSVNLLETAIAAIPEKDRATYVNFQYLLNNLAEAYHGLGNPTNARKYAVETERWIRARYVADSVQLASNLVMLGATLIDVEMFEEAERVQRELLANRDPKGPTKEVGMAYAKALLGMALFGQKRDVDAEPLLTQGYETLTALRAEIRLDTEERRVKAGRNLAQLYERTGRPEKAAALRAQLPTEQASKPQPETK